MVDRLVTYFDNYDSEINNAVYFNDQEYENHNWYVRARQFRLNHKPFTYKINLVSDKPVETVVRVYIGPKYDEYGRAIDMNNNRLNFVEIDRFLHSVVPGKNVIERNSHDLFYAEDYTSNENLWQQVNAGFNGVADVPVYHADVRYTFPNR